MWQYTCFCTNNCQDGQCKYPSGDTLPDDWTIKIPLFTSESYKPAMGWVCPLCGRANAPHVATCDCTGG